MRTEDKAGYICLAIAIGFYMVEGWGASTTGRFFNAAGMGFFIASVIKQLKGQK